MGKRVTEEDRQRAQALFAIGKSFRDISKELDNRVSAAWINGRAREEGWLRGVLPDKLVSEDTPQVFESANATPDERNASTDYMSAAMKRKFIERKVEIANQLGDGVLRLYGQMFAPHVVREAKVLSGGKDIGATVEIVDIELTEPSPADKKHLATALAILVDKASLLVGDATSRVETSSMTPEQQRERLTFIRSEFEKRRQAELDKERARPADADGATG